MRTDQPCIAVPPPDPERIRRERREAAMVLRVLRRFERRLKARKSVARKDGQEEG